MSFVCLGTVYHAKLIHSQRILHKSLAALFIVILKMISIEAFVGITVVFLNSQRLIDQIHCWPSPGLYNCLNLHHGLFA